MRVPLVVHFDTNIVRDLAEIRLPRAEHQTNIIRELIEKGKLIIAPSFEVLYEILSAPDLCNAKQIRNAQFYEGIVDWSYALKPSNQMFQEDIISLASKGGPSTPFCAIDGNQSGFIQSIRKGDGIFPDHEWEKVVKKSRRQNERFVNVLFNNFVKKLSPKGKKDLRKHPQKTWQKWWEYGGLAEILADSFGNKLQVQTKYSLLTLPTVRAAVGYILHTWYRQIIDCGRLKPTTHYDFRNAVLAGGVGSIITQDKKLRKAINHIPNLNVNTWTLGEFISSIQ